MRRFWTEASAVETENGLWAVALDGKLVKTPAKHTLAVETEKLAKVLAAEWAAQGETVNTATMPLTRLVNVAIDRTPDTRDGIVEEILRYAQFDLLCYRAAAPQRLAMTQAAFWDPPLEWAATQLEARLSITTTLTPPPHDAAALAALESAVTPLDPLRLTVLTHITALTGSAILAFALLQGAMAGDAVLAAMRVDETFQNETWGLDDEAVAAAAALTAEVLAVEALIKALK